MTPAPDPTARLFFALWPGDALRGALVECQRAWSWPPAARLVPADKLHVTLHFLGNVPCERIGALLALHEELSAGPLEPLRLDVASVWRGGIAVLESAAPPPSLASLQARLGALLRREGLAIEPEARFRPHVTLARAASGARPPQRWPPIVWERGEVVLVESRRRPPDGYRVLGRDGAATA